MLEPAENAVAPVAVPEGKRAARSGVLIVNTKSRKGAEQFAMMRDCLRQGGLTLDAEHPLDNPERLPDVIGKAKQDGAKLILIGGGDGSLRTAADLLAYSDVTMGILPLGTVNDFARNLEIEPTIEAACKVICEGHTAQIDLGQANETYFMITASTGFSCQTQECLSPRLKKAFGPFGYMIASLLAVRRLQPIAITLHSEQGDETYDVVQAGVVNGHSWMGGKIEIPGKDLESGRLAFYAIPPQPGIAFLRLARDLIQSRFFRNREMRAFLTRDMTLTTPTPQKLVIDGDLLGQTPVRFRVASGALRVCVPAGFTGGNSLPHADEAH